MYYTQKVSRNIQMSLFDIFLTIIKFMCYSVAKLRSSKCGCFHLMQLTTAIAVSENLNN